MHVPKGPDDLTPAWLTAAFHEGGRPAATTVIGSSAAPLAARKGLVGQVVRVSIEYERGTHSGPRSLIAKFSSADDRMRKRSVGKYVREVRFYQELAPRTTLPVPECFYSAVEPDSGYHIVLLEDLGNSVSGTEPEICSPDQAKLAITQIANFHADWWQSPELVNIDWLPTPVYDQAALVKAHEEWWPQFLRKAGDALPVAVVEIGERLGPHRARIMRELFGGSPRTLIHRDYHHDNIVFGAPDAARPFVVLDWQGMSFGRGVWDVAYFMCQSLDTETRLAIEMDLLRSYHQALLDGGVAGYSFEQCMHDFRLALLQRFGSLISTIAAMPFSPGEIQRHIDILLPRNVAAILDHDAATLLDA